MALTSSPESPRPLREIAQAVKGWVERLGSVWVSGQVIQLSRRTGAIHFLTLRDAQAEVSVSVTCSTAVLDLAGPLHEGMAVVTQLKPTYYLPSGRLSFDCLELRPAGEGRLLAQIEERKRLLRSEGLFDPSRKRPLPLLPRRIGLVTGRGSAAERDIVVNIHLRWPAAVIALRYALMQGPQCAEQVAVAVTELDAQPSVDVIIIARGGGSVEDLLPFSDERLVRLVAATQTPIVSAIGHETDTPILDLVADLRASTPTDAAKRVVPDARFEAAQVAAARGRLRQALTARIEAHQTQLQALRSRPVLRDPLAGYAVFEVQHHHQRDRLRRAITQHLEQSAAAVRQCLTQIRTMSPQSTLERGYAILLTAAGATVTDPAQVTPGQALTARLERGPLPVTVSSPVPEVSHAQAQS